jgi:hypothetical protein
LRALPLHRTRRRLLRLDELACLLHDDLAARDLGRIRQCLAQLLLAHHVGRDAGRLLGVLRAVEEADRTEDAVSVSSAMASNIERAGGLDNGGPVRDDAARHPNRVRPSVPRVL